MFFKFFKNHSILTAILLISSTTSVFAMHSPLGRVPKTSRITTSPPKINRRIIKKHGNASSSSSQSTSMPHSKIKLAEMSDMDAVCSHYGSKSPCHVEKCSSVDFDVQPDSPINHSKVKKSKISFPITPEVNNPFFLRKRKLLDSPSYCDPTSPLSQSLGGKKQPSLHSLPARRPCKNVVNLCVEINVKGELPVFSIVKDDVPYQVYHMDIDQDDDVQRFHGELKTMTPRQLQTFFDDGGFIAVNECESGDFMLRAKMCDSFKKWGTSFSLKSGRYAVKFVDIGNKDLLVVQAAENSVDNIFIERNHNGFFVVQDLKYHQVQMWNVDKKLREMTPSQLQRFLEMGAHICVRQDDHGNFMIQEAKIDSHLSGGGPVAGLVAWCTVNVIGYGAAFIVATGAVATGGPVAGAVVVTEGLGTVAVIDGAATLIGGYFTACPLLP